MIELPSRLVASLQRGDCIPFVGAGVSCQAGLPSWGTTLEQMQRHLIALSPPEEREDEIAYLAKADPLLIAGRFRSRVDDEEYLSFLLNIFDQSVAPATAHYEIVKLEAPYIITTNFDPLLEQAYLSVHGRLPTVCYRYEHLVVAATKNQPYIIKLHGTITDPESIVFTEDDYVALQHRQEALLEHVRDAIALQRALFLGYSLTDPDFRSLYLKSNLLTAGRRRTDYAVMTDPRRPEQEEWRTRGLSFLAIPTHEDLPPALVAIREAIIRPSPPATIGAPAIPIVPPVLTATPTGVSAGANRRITRRAADAASSGPIQLELPGDVAELVSSGSRHLLFGPPGAGKSHLCREIYSAVISDGSHVTLVEAKVLQAQGVGLAEWLVASTETPDLQNLAAATPALALLIVDGLDELDLAVRRSVPLALRDLQAEIPSLSILVASRDVDLDGFDNWERWDLQGLSAEEATALLAANAGDDASRDEAAMVCRAHPQLFERPLFSVLMRDSGVPYSDIGGDTTEIDILAISLSSALGSDSDYLREIARAVARAWLTTRGYRFSQSHLLALITEELQVASTWREGLASDLVTRLSSDLAPFISTPTHLSARHRALVDMLIAEGLVDIGVFVDTAKLLVKDRTWDHLVTLGLSRLDEPDQGELIEHIWRWSPQLAVRSVLELPQFDTYLDRLITPAYEDELVGLVRSLLGLESEATSVRVCDVLALPRYRNGHVLYYVVELLEIIASDGIERAWQERARTILDRVWRESDGIDVGAELTPIPGGYYKIGRDEKCVDDESPRHQVFLEPYSIGTREVTNSEFKRFCPRHVPDRRSSGDTMPVVDVTWCEAQMYCRWLCGPQGNLPTEAQWEVAAQGPENDGRAFPWGETFETALANLDDPTGSVKAVASYPSNDFGLYDMTGNVFEWCYDWYDPDFYAVSSLSNPRGPAIGRFRAMRGGAWARSTETGRCSYRVRQVPSTRDVLVGFRIALIGH
jgi:formylglycine-generating enzyme